MKEKIKLQSEALNSKIDSITDTNSYNETNSLLKKILKEFYADMKNLDNDEKKNVGKLINDFKNEMESLLESKKDNTNKPNADTKKVDLSIYNDNIKFGMKHPLIAVYEKMEETLVRMGFEIVQGPEIDLDRNNFEMLNMENDHPARDMQDTFYIEHPDVILRSHTSTVQIRYMETHKPPFKILSPGVVYRVDEIDAQHTPCFYQVEGLVVGEDITFSDLKGTLIAFVKGTFGDEYEVRITPSFYPYTEPSAGIDMSCVICKGKGCKTCRNTGWLRIGGAGMVHPKVFKNVGYPKETVGFAFGFGVNKFPMLYYGIPEMRTLYENDIELWKQIGGE